MDNAIFNIINYPPYIDGTIPSFTEWLGEGYTSMINGLKFQGGGLRVPYTKNPAIFEDTNYIIGFEAMIKDLNSNILGYLEARDEIQSFFDNSEIIFKDLTIRKPLEDGSIKTDQFVSGQYYKIQIRYIANIEMEAIVGNLAYSTAAITKFTTLPEITVENLNVEQVNGSKLFYKGLYKTADLTEPLYSYEFQVYDDKGKLYTSSEIQIHNSETNKLETDNSNQITTYYLTSYDEFFTTLDLENDKKYDIIYKIKTINNLELQSQFYPIIKEPSVNIDINVNFDVTVNKDNGYVDIRLSGNAAENGGGKFLLLRSSEDSNYMDWVELTRSNIVYDLSAFKWKDWTVEQGKFYKYALVQYNDHGIYSNKKISNLVYADFEDMFLSDGERQLKIKFNPKVSSFKNTVLESKTDTIGGKYPFIFRNAMVNYKEFPISGLISYYMDEEDTFIPKEEIGLTAAAGHTSTHNLVGYNYRSEREFKLAVQEWLNNGKPKLFRSPGEGNYVVRLMNVSLSPEDKLGRMLHTFNSTAYEINNANYKTLKSINLVSNKLIEDKNTYYKTVKLDNNEWYEQPEEWITIIDNNTILGIQCSGMVPGDKIEYNGNKIIIGSSGSYSADIPTNQPIKIYSNNSRMGAITYHYEPIKIVNDFDRIIGTSYTEVLETINLSDYQGDMTEILEGVILARPNNKNNQISRIFRAYFYINDSTNDFNNKSQHYWISINAETNEISKNHIDLLQFESKNFEIYSSNFDQPISSIWVGKKIKVDIYYQLVDITYDDIKEDY